MIALHHWLGSPSFGNKYLKLLFSLKVAREWALGWSSCELVKLMATGSHHLDFLQNHVEFCNEMDMLMLRVTALVYFTLIIWFKRYLYGQVWVMLLVRNSAYG